MDEALRCTVCPRGILSFESSLAKRRLASVEDPAGA